MESPPRGEVVNQAALLGRVSRGFQTDLQTINHLRRRLVLLRHRLDAAARIASGPGQIFLRIVDFVLVVLLIGLRQDELIVQIVFSGSVGLSLFRGQPLNQFPVRGQRILGLFRSEEHTSELQSLTNLVCRLLLEKKKKLYKQSTLLP